MVSCRLGSGMLFGGNHSYGMAKQKKVSVSLESEDIPILVQTLEEALDHVFCENPHCETCVLGSITIHSIIEKLYERMPKLEYKTEI